MSDSAAHILPNESSLVILDANVMLKLCARK
jgi:hypothetical protein